MSKLMPPPSSPLPEVGSPSYQVMRDDLVRERTLQYAAGGLLLGMIIGPEGTADILGSIANGIDSPGILFVLEKIRNSVEHAVAVAEIQDGTLSEYARNYIIRVPVSGIPVAMIGAAIGHLVGKATSPEVVLRHGQQPNP